MDTDKGTSAGWNLCESVESVDVNGLWFVVCGLWFVVCGLVFVLTRRREGAKVRKEDFF